MFPLKDNVPTRSFPIVTVALIAANVAVWLWEVQTGVEHDVLRYGYYPCTVEGPCTQPASLIPHLPWWEGAFSSMFLHASWVHVGGNMLFLWIFGNNVEDSMGHLRFVVFYVACGLAAALIQVFVTPASGVPMVGASGAISGVMGGYVVLYPRARVYTLVPLGFFITTIVLPAWTMIGYWALIQVFSGVGSLGADNEGGVAFWAHVGGLVAGIVLVKLFARDDYVQEHRAGTWAPRRLGWSR